MGRFAGTHDATKYPDMVPAAFTFTDAPDQELSTLVTSDEITVTSVACPVLIQVSSNGAYQIDGGAWTSADGRIGVNSVAKVRATSSSAYETAVAVVLVVGSVRDTFTITTIVAP